LEVSKKTSMKHLTTSFLVLACIFMLTECNRNDQNVSVRQPVDTVGFAQYSWQVDSVLARIARLQPEKLSRAESAFDPSAVLRVAISPHDDYSYVGYLYPALFQHIRSDVVVMFGVGHKAKNFNLENKIVFGTYMRWKSPKGTVKISDLQNSIMKELPEDMFVVNDSMQAVEHSLEALVPFLQHYSPDVEIIPVIVPYMPFSRMEEIASSLAVAIEQTMKKAKLTWGPGWSIVISTDAVHYGNEDWGGSNYDRFGVDSAGYARAVDYEKNIMNSMLAGDLTPEKIREFSSCTVQDSDYHQYKWTWCGRYAVPLGLLTAYDISVSTGVPLSGIAVGYSTSIAEEPLPVADIGMGNTAPAKLTHWVGYAAVGYK
jgi:AmmeMemoRadiSam system protein B